SHFRIKSAHSPVEYAMWPPLFKQASVPSSTANPSALPVAPHPSRVLPSKRSIHPSFFSDVESSLSAALAMLFIPQANPKMTAKVTNKRRRIIAPRYRSVTKLYPYTGNGKLIDFLTQLPEGIGRAIAKGAVIVVYRDPSFRPRLFANQFPLQED